jgi:hypothetical protein
MLFLQEITSYNIISLKIKCYKNYFEKKKIIIIYRSASNKNNEGDHLILHNFIYKNPVDR